MQRTVMVDVDSERSAEGPRPCPKAPLQLYPPPPELAPVPAVRGFEPDDPDKWNSGGISKLKVLYIGGHSLGGAAALAFAYWVKLAFEDTNPGLKVPLLYAQLSSIKRVESRGEAVEAAREARKINMWSPRSLQLI